MQVLECIDGPTFEYIVLYWELGMYPRITKWITAKIKRAYAWKMKKNYQLSLQYQQFSVLIGTNSIMNVSLGFD